MKIRGILLLMVACMLTGACVQDVDFSGAFEKKVVVHCVIYSVVRFQEDFVLPTQSVYYKPLTGDRIQHLHMYFSSPDGKKERLPSATARLYDNETGGLLGEFLRTSDWEWQLVYEPAYETPTDGVKKYSLNLRLEITDIPGVETSITSTTRLDRSIDVESVKWVYYSVGDTRFDKYMQNLPVATPAWLLPESFIGRGFGNEPDDFHTSHHAIKSTYAFADPFSFSGGCYQYGVRILPDNHEGLFSLTLNDFSSHVPSGTRESCRFYLSYVSEDYDRYLHDDIVYRMRHDNEADPLKHLYEDQVFSNIDGGTGIFGAEAVFYFSRSSHIIL